MINTVSVKYLPLLKTFTLLLLLTVCRQGWASKECFFQGFLAPSLSVTGGEPVTFRPYSAGPVALKSYTLPSSIYSECAVGNDGESLFSRREDLPEVGSVDSGVSSYSAAVFETNVPGIVYALRMETTDGVVKGYVPFTPTTSEILVGDIHNQEDMVDGKSWRFVVTLYQMPTYSGVPAGTGDLHLKNSGKIGGFRLGTDDSSQSSNPLVTVTMSNMSIPFQRPSCMTSISSAQGSSVTLGSYDINQINNNETVQVPFSITGSQCSSTLRMITKLTTSNGTLGLLGNTSTVTPAARGVAVKITTEKNQQLSANDPTSSYTVTDNMMPYSFTQNYYAQLVPGGETVTEGDFKATGIFSVTYE